MPQIVELYINFGWIGVPLGMFLIGTLYALLELHLHRASSGGALIGASHIVQPDEPRIEFYAIVWGGIPLSIPRLLRVYQGLLPPLKKQELVVGTAIP
jgi:hypothetical protein